MKEVYRSYYTKSDPIVQYMVQMLSVDSGMRVFEPCAGDGVFIDALNSRIPNLSIDIYELNPEAIELLKRKYKNDENVKVFQDDTLTSGTLILFANAGGIYDRIIANPPYGGWLDYEKRKYLKKLYPSLYVKETYTLFLYRCIQLLRDRGKLVFIIPDTFLNLHMHTQLREYVLTRTKVVELCLFPSCFFPGINFGYSNLCIVTLEKSTNKDECFNNMVRVVTGLREVSELCSLARLPSSRRSIISLQQRGVYDNIDHALFVSKEPKVTRFINHSDIRIGDIADCVTGFYSGNDKKYLRVRLKNVKNAKNYRAVDRSLLCEASVDSRNILDGIEGPAHSIPIVKGGGIRYFKPDNWYMDWGVEAVRHYKKDKKARFQNSQYYFKCGIGVPMVSSTSLTAALIENRLFDQSIVGVFPHDQKWTYYLIAFFNSPTCNQLIRTINPSANNSANYIKKIPVILPSTKRLGQINSLIESIIRSLKNGKELPHELEAKVYGQIREIYGF